MVLLIVGIVNPSTRRGRAKYSRNHRTLDPVTLRKIASESLADGVLLATPEKIGHCLQIGQATVSRLLEVGDLPVIYLSDDLKRRWPRVPVLALMDYLDRKTAAATE
jgi:hypothetical protein